MSNNASADVDTRTYTKNYLMLAIRKLITRLDLLKVTISSIDTSCISSEPSKTLAQIQQDLNVYKICRKKLHLMINLGETLDEKLDEKCNVDMSKAIDSIYWALMSIKKDLLKLADSRLTNVVEEIDDIIEYANGNIRNIGLNLIKRSVEKTLNMPFRVIKTEVDAEVIDVSSDSDNGKKSEKSTKKVAKKGKGKDYKLRVKNNKKVVKKSPSTYSRKGIIKCGMQRTIRTDSESQGAPVESQNNRKNDKSAQTENTTRATRNARYNKNTEYV